MQGRRYHIEELLGRGAFGAVYRARLVGDRGFEKEVALKVLRGEQATADQLARLSDEARLLAQVRHRALPHVDGLVRLEDGRWAVVMEYIEGADLGRLRRLGRLPARPALQICAEVASALWAAWTAGPPEAPLRLVHRDVKPSNVVVTPTGDVKLLDFGIARAEVRREARTDTGLVVGTLRYMAPERFTGDHRSGGDVYALGCTLAALVATLPDQPLGTLPEAVHRDLVAALCERVADAETAPQGLGAFLGELLAFDPGDRPTVDAVRTRCQALMAQADGPDLADWVRRTLPDVPEGRGDEDQLVGTTLTEHRVAPAIAPERVSRITVRVGVAAALGGIAMGAVAVASAIALWPAPAPLAPAPPVRVTPRQVTDDPPRQWSPNLSADGRWLVFERSEEAVVMDLQTGEERVATDTFDPPAHYPSLDPDGQRVWFSADDRIHVVDSRGGTPKPVVDGILPQVSPDGRYLAYVSLKPDGRVDSARVRDLVNGADWPLVEGAHTPRWSPDSKQLLVGMGSGIALVAREGGTPVPLGIDGLEPRWTPDRLWVRFLRGHVDDLRWFDMTTGMPSAEAVTGWAGTKRIEQLASSLDGSRLAWTQSFPQYRPVVHPIKRNGDLGEGRLVPLDEDWTGSFALAPGGDRIAYAAFRQDTDALGRAHVIIADTDGTSRSTLGGGLGAVGHVSWTPDGDVVVWDTSGARGSLLSEDSDYGGETLFRLPPDGKAVPILALDPDQYRAALLSPDGSRVAVVVTEGGYPAVIEVPGYRGAPPVPPVTLGPAGWEPLAWSPNGTRLVAVKQGEGVGILDAETLAVTVLDPEGRHAVWLDDRRVFVHAHDEVRRVRVDNGRSETLVELHRADPTAGRARLSISPDRRWLLVDSTEISSDIWVAEVAPQNER